MDVNVCGCGIQYVSLCVAFVCMWCVCLCRCTTVCSSMRMYLCISIGLVMCIHKTRPFIDSPNTGHLNVVWTHSVVEWLCVIALCLQPKSQCGVDISHTVNGIADSVGALSVSVCVCVCVCVCGWVGGWVGGWVWVGVGVWVGVSVCLCVYLFV